MPKGKKCWAAFSADTSPALISLGALVTIKGPETNRQVPLEKIYTEDALKPLTITGHEVVTEVIIPGQKSRQGTAFVKFSLREGLEFAVLNVAVVLKVEDDGVSCREARITVGAISAAPMRMLRAEEVVIGQRLSKGLLDQVAQMVAAGARLCPRLGFSAMYLKECLRVQTCRALNLAAQRVSRHKEKKTKQ
jgi:CO/xanthine dehydrogenase FAD-binding subunit